MFNVNKEQCEINISIFCSFDMRVYCHVQLFVHVYLILIICVCINEEMRYTHSLIKNFEGKSERSTRSFCLMKKENLNKKRFLYLYKWYMYN